MSIVESHRDQDPFCESNLRLAVYLATYMNAETIIALKDAWREHPETEKLVAKKRLRPRFKVATTDEFKKVCL